MNKINWDEIKEATEFDNPKPGAYIAVICRVEDVTDKEYLLIEWDFAEGAYKDNNRETFERAEFWPIQLRRSYKLKSLGFFKSFKTALEESNPGYRFDEFNLRDMVGRRFGAVLGEEEYINNSGEVKTRLYVAQTRSIQAIQKGDFKVPELKRLAENRKPSDEWSGFASQQNSSSVTSVWTDEQFNSLQADKKLPF